MLVDIAANLAAAAGKAPATSEKQSLLRKLDEHRELMDDPLYMTATMRANLTNQIQAVDESRGRVQRDINRNIRLDESEASMTSLLDQQKTKDAYDVRKNLLREFPELHDHGRMVTLIHRASDIQQTLVKPSSELPKTLSEAAPSKSLSTIVLTTLVGNPAPDLQSEIQYLRAGGSILAFDGEIGETKVAPICWLCKRHASGPIVGRRGRVAKRLVNLGSDSLSQRRWRGRMAGGN